MKNLQIFKNERFGEMRTVEINNIPYICLADVCKILELKQVSRVKSRLNQDGVISNKVIDKLGREQEAIFIDENNLYKVIFQSRKPEAETFTNWVTKEVLPSIRKSGMYLTDELLDNPDLAIKFFKKLKQEKDEKKQLQLENIQQKQIIGELKPKADYTDRILKNKGLVTINAIANDYGMTAQKMNKRLHDLKIQYRQGKQWLLYEEYRSFGYTQSETIDLQSKEGIHFCIMNTKWTQKGRLFLYEMLKKNGIVPVIER